MRVVIAEDSVLLREGLTRLLVEAGHTVVAAAGDGGEFLRAVDAQHPDAVLVDVRTPPTFTDEGLRAAVLALMAEGRSNSAIAQTLVVGAGAVEKHINNIFTKLCLAPTDDRGNRRVLAVLRYLGTGLSP